MTNKQFNEKYKFCIEGKGVQIKNTNIITYLNVLFEDLSKIENFKFYSLEIRNNKLNFNSNLSHALEILIESALLNGYNVYK